MSGQDFALGGGNGVKGGLGVAMQFFQLHLVVTQALLVVGFAFGVGLNQGVGDVLGVGCHQDGVVPDVRVKFAVVVVVAFVIVVMVMTAFFGFKRLYAFGRFCERNFALFDGALNISRFQTQAVEQD